MQLRYDFRVYPEPGQRMALAKAFGCARVVFNDGSRARQGAHAAGLPYISETDLQKQVITAARQTPEREWLGEVSSVVLVQSPRDLHTAYRNFFSSLTGQRTGPKIGPPRFKSRKDRTQSIRLTANGFGLRPNGRLYVAKVGDLRVKWSRALPSAPTSVTVTLDAAGRYWASFVVEAYPKPRPEVEAETGIDLGMNHFVVLADGRKAEAPKFSRRAEKKLQRTQKALSRKAKGSNNRDKARKHGRTFVKVSRAFPSSQLCSACGFRDGPKPLQVRVWTCTCGAEHDRDHNAAKNILFEGRRIVAAGRAETLNASQSAGKTRTLVPAQRVEAGTHPDPHTRVAGIPALQDREDVNATVRRLPGFFHT